MWQPRLKERQVVCQAFVVLYFLYFCVFCTFVLLYFCTFVLLYFCTFALLYFCSIKDETGGLGSRERKSHEKGLVFRDLDVSNLVR